MKGGIGSDNYHIENIWNGDHDVIHNADVTAVAADKDTLSISGQVDDYRELWSKKDDSSATGGDDLIVTQIGKTGSLRIEDWFSNDKEARLDSIVIKETDEDAYAFLLNNHFDSLIQAMSTVAIPTVPAGINDSSYDGVRTAWENLAVDGQ